ncbi:MAG: glutathione S-transferase family protein [Pseudomonadota bacterium]
MAITVWGRATSSNVQVVMWAIGELGLEVTRHDIGHTYGGTDTPEYLAMNPNGKVPTIRDGDLVLYESQAILRYLAAKYGDAHFWPKDLAIRAELDLWCEWIRTTFQPEFNYKIFWQKVRIGAADRDEAQIARDAEKLKPLVAQLDTRLGAGPYLNGDHLSWADIVVGHLLYRYATVDFDKAATPNLDAYYQSLTDRPAYAEHAMVSYEPLRVV